MPGGGYRREFPSPPLFSSLPTFPAHITDSVCTAARVFFSEQSANLIVLLALARKATLSPSAIHALLLSILTSAPSGVYLSPSRTANVLSTLLGLLQSQEELQEVGKDVVLALEGLQDVGVLLAQGSAGYEVSKALRPIIVSLVKK